jgi:hypothetical protein
MGCFDSTCAFTRTAVGSGDEILIVALDPKSYCCSGGGFTTYDLSNNAGYYKRVKTSEDMPNPVSPFRFLGIGHYNSYGTIDEFDNDAGLEQEERSWWDYQFIVHREVAEGLLNKKLDPNNLEDDVIRLIEIAYLARVQLHGNDLLGVQHADKAERVLQLKLLGLATTILERELEMLEDDEEDDDDWYDDED